MIDLHIHSAHSLDGEYSPKEIIDQCLTRGVEYVAIADHNNIDAYEEALEYAEEKDIHLIPAVEIDCYYKNHPLHLLIYGLDGGNSDLKELCDRQLLLEINASKERIDKINELGFDLSVDDFKHLEAPVITPEDIAEVLLKDERYPRHPLLLPYRKNGMRGDNPLVNFYWDYYAKGKPSYIKLDYPLLEDVLALSKKHGGISILAHPGASLRENFSIIEDIIRTGIDGLEVFSSYHSQFDVERLMTYVNRSNLLMTAGSDYHGKIKPTVRLGDVDYYGYEDDFLKSFNTFTKQL